MREMTTRDIRAHQRQTHAVDVYPN